MKIFIKKSIALIIMCGIISCTPTMTAYFWNGHYSLKKTGEEMKIKQEEFYAKETTEQKKLRKRNRKICFNVSGAYSGNWDQGRYTDCMKERGSPIP